MRAADRGRAVPPDGGPLAKKEIRRAVRQSQSVKDLRPEEAYDQARRHPGRDLVGDISGHMRFFLKDANRAIWVDAFWTLIFWAFYSTFIYYWETFLFNRRQRKLKEGGSEVGEDPAPVDVPR